MHAGLVPLPLASLSGQGLDEPLASERKLKQQDLERCSPVCSEVAPGLFVAGQEVAASLDTLRAHKITHILNCVGQIFTTPFSGDFEHLELRLRGE